MPAANRFEWSDTDSTFEPTLRRAMDPATSLQHGLAETSPPVPGAAVPQLLQRSPIAANAPVRAAALLRTQQTYGNRAVQRSVARIQTKMAISEPGDPLEREADRVAEQAMTGEECECGGTCEECQAAQTIQTKLSVGASARLQRQVSDPAATAGGPDVDTRLAQLAGGGQPLSDGARSFAESRLGHDFGDVRVHADADAAEAAHAVDARGYTVGNHIVFGQSQFNPATTEGQRLLAHELAHVIQQTAAPNRIQRQPAESDDDVHVPKEVCGTGEIKGQVYICCHPNPHPHVRECLDLHNRVFKECYDKTEKDDRARELCEGKAAFEDCHCLARHLGQEYCRCGGLV